MIMWDMHDHTTEEQARKNRDSSNGKSFSVEDTTTSDDANDCLLYTSPSPRDGLLSRMPSSA